MHRHITYYTQSTVCNGGFSNKFLNSSSWAYAGFANGGKLIFFEGGLATRCIATRLLGGGGKSRPSPPPPSRIKKNFWAILETFLLLFLLMGTFLLRFSDFGGPFHHVRAFLLLFTSWWGSFCGLPPPLRKFLRAPMIARAWSPEIFCVTAI